MCLDDSRQLAVDFVREMGPRKRNPPPLSRSRKAASSRESVKPVFSKPVKMIGIMLVVLFIKPLCKNTNPPYNSITSFTELQHSTVLESAAVGIPLAWLRAESLEEAYLETFHCETLHPAFRIQKQTDGIFVLVTGIEFDREQKENYTVAIQCESWQSPWRPNISHHFQHDVKSLFSWKDVLTHDVRILDANDCVPVFEEQSYFKIIPENNPDGMPLLTINASDCDEGLNGKITYGLSPEAKGLVHLDPISGRLSAAQSFDFEKASKFVFQVSASDQGSPSNTAKVMVTLMITDTNDNCPKFSQDTYRSSFRGTVGKGVMVAHVMATDADGPPYDAIHYSLEGDDTGRFVIDKRTGVIQANKSLEMNTDYEVFAVAINVDPPYLKSKRSTVIVIVHSDFYESVWLSLYKAVMIFGIIFALAFCYCLMRLCANSVQEQRSSCSNS